LYAIMKKSKEVRREKYQMGKFKQKLYRFMYGRYGTDALYNFLTWLNVVLILISFIVTAIIPEGTVGAIVSLSFSILIVAIFVYEIFRTMSRNIAKRRRENEIYLKAKGAIKRFLSRNTSSRTRTYHVDDATYIFRDCTKCSSVLRLPRRVGRHKVKCPRCSHSFYVKAKKFKFKKNR